MGLETIIIVLGVILMVPILFFIGRSRRAARKNDANNPNLQPPRP